MHIIKSERLRLRTWQKSDIPLMAKINMDEKVMRYFPNTQDLKHTSSFIERMDLLFQEKEYCFFATEIIETGEFIGFIGLSYQDYEAPVSPFVEIGWRLKPSSWGKGYATEGAKVCLQYAFDKLDLPEIYAIAPTINIPSIKVMEKIGMKKLLEFDHPYLLQSEELKKCMMYKATLKTI